MSGQKTLGVLQQKLVGIAKVIAKLAAEAAKEASPAATRKKRGTTETKSEKPKRKRRTNAEIEAATATKPEKVKRKRRTKAEIEATKSAEPVAEKPKRKRRTKAEMEAARAGVAPTAKETKVEETPEHTGLSEKELGDCTKCKYCLQMNGRRRCTMKQMDITDPKAQAKGCASAFYGLSE